MWGLEYGYDLTNILEPVPEGWNGIHQFEVVSTAVSHFYFYRTLDNFNINSLMEEVGNMQQILIILIGIQFKDHKVRFFLILVSFS